MAFSIILILLYSFKFFLNIIKIYQKLYNKDNEIDLNIKKIKNNYKQFT